MKNIVALVASWTGKSPEEVQTLIEADDTSIVDSLKSMKVLTQAEFDTALENRIKTLGESDIKKLPENLTRKLYDNHKASALESAEKQLQETYGTEFKQGFDYNNINQLVDKIVASKGKKSESTDTDGEKYKKLYADAQEAHKLELQKAQEQANQTITGMVRKGALNTIKPFIPEKEMADKKLGFIEYEFNQQYEISQLDGEFRPIDKVTGKPAVDGSHNLLSVDQVMKNIAGGLVSLTDTVPISGRGAKDEPEKKPAGNSDYSKYADEEAFVKGLIEKGVDPYSHEGLDEMTKYQKEKAK